jgi:hypothetical protein
MIFNSLYKLIVFFFCTSLLGFDYMITTAAIIFLLNIVNEVSGFILYGDCFILVREVYKDWFILKYFEWFKIFVQILRQLIIEYDLGYFKFILKFTFFNPFEILAPNPFQTWHIWLGIYDTFQQLRGKRSLSNISIIFMYLNPGVIVLQGLHPLKSRLKFPCLWWLIMKEGGIVKSDRVSLGKMLI